MYYFNTMSGFHFNDVFQIVFYSTEIFVKSGLKGEKPKYATLGVGIINAVMTGISMVLVERAGRKTLHLIGIGGMAVVTLLLTICMAFIVSSRMT